MDHLISVRAALKAASVNGTPPPVLAIPIPGHAPVCIRTQLLKGALKGVTINSVALLESGWVNWPPLLRQPMKKLLRHSRIQIKPYY